LSGLGAYRNSWGRKRLGRFYVKYEILNVLREQNVLLQRILEAVERNPVGRYGQAIHEECPSFARDNPWIDVLRGRRR